MYVIVSTGWYSFHNFIQFSQSRQHKQVREHYIRLRTNLMCLSPFQLPHSVSFDQFGSFSIPNWVLEIPYRNFCDQKNINNVHHTGGTRWSRMLILYRGSLSPSYPTHLPVMGINSEFLQIVLHKYISSSFVCLA